MSLRSAAIARGAIILTHDFVNREWRDTTIGKNCFLGYNCIVLPGITVNCVAPGFMATEMTYGYDEDQMASIRRRATLGLTKPVDAAGAVAYLLGPEAARVTGTVITVDGGSTA